jgi:hypothetical protein
MELPNLDIDRILKLDPMCAKSKILTLELMVTVPNILAELPSRAKPRHETVEAKRMLSIIDRALPKVEIA